MKLRRLSEVDGVSSFVKHTVQSYFKEKAASLREELSVGDG